MGVWGRKKVHKGDPCAVCGDKREVPGWKTYMKSRCTRCHTAAKREIALRHKAKRRAEMPAVGVPFLLVSTGYQASRPCKACGSDNVAPSGACLGCGCFNARRAG